MKLPPDDAPRRPVARIAESYFQRLLHQTPPRQAVSELAQNWFARTSWTAPQFGLSTPEHQVEMVLIYTGEVGNGGHTQFFSNRGGSIAALALVALRDVGLEKLSDILARACALFPKGQVPVDRNEVDLQMARWNLLQKRASGRLDREVWSLDTDVALLAYLRAHEAEILRPERGLSE